MVDKGLANIREGKVVIVGVRTDHPAGGRRKRFEARRITEKEISSQNTYISPPYLCTCDKMTSSHSNTPTRMDQALEFLHKNPSEKPITAARIYHINAKTLNTKIRRARERANAPPPTNGGQNRILSEAQIKAIYKYVEDSYHAGYGASKQMVFTAIGHLRSAEIPSKPPPSWRWF